MINLRIHHFFDIIRDYGEGRVPKKHEYGHSYDEIAEKIYSDRVGEVKLVIKSDDVCNNCIMLNKGHCTDLIGHRDDFKSKESFNDYLDKRIMNILGYHENQVVRVRELINEADKYLENIFYIYDGNDIEHTKLRRANVAKGLKKKNKAR